MSRFDAFAKSRASGRGLFRSWRGSRPDAALDADVSRRDLLKRAGLVGGAVVAGSTLIQSVTSPALAVSPVCTGTNATSTCGGTCPVRCPISQGCALDVDCEAGLICTSGICQVGPLPNTLNGGPCTRDAECRSFYCDSSSHQCVANPIGETPPGQPCHAANQAAADLQCDGSGGTCTNGTCKSGNRGYCRTQADCADLYICHTDDRECLYPP